MNKETYVSKVLALLAKAESTQFPEEAEMLFAIENGDFTGFENEPDGSPGEAERLLIDFMEQWGRVTIPDDVGPEDRMEWHYCMGCMERAPKLWWFSPGVPTGARSTMGIWFNGDGNWECGQGHLPPHGDFQYCPKCEKERHAIHNRRPRAAGSADEGQARDQ